MKRKIHPKRIARMRQQAAFRRSIREAMRCEPAVVMHGSGAAGKSTHTALQIVERMSALNTQGVTAVCIESPVEPNPYFRSGQLR